MKFLVLSFVLLCAPGAMLDFATKQWEKMPAFEVQDAYKWLFQATRGGEHAVPGEETARKWMENEWKGLNEPQKDEPLLEPLCGDGKDTSISRLNLRPFRAQGGEMDTALFAFIESSKKFDPSKENFLVAWSKLGKRLEKKPQGKLTSEEWKKFDEAMRAKDYPAVHHSKGYGEAYRPAYRIITGEQAKKVLAELKKN